MKAHNIPKEVYEKHIKAELIWRYYLQEKFRPEVSEHEIQYVLTSIQEGEKHPTISHYLPEETFSFSQVLFSLNPYATAEERKKRVGFIGSLKAIATGHTFLATAKKDQETHIITKKEVPGSYLPKELKRILKDLKENEISQVFETQSGHLVFVKHTYTPAPQTLSAHHVRLALFYQKMTALDQRERQNLEVESYVDIKDKTSSFPIT